MPNVFILLQHFLFSLLWWGNISSKTKDLWKAQYFGFLSTGVPLLWLSTLKKSCNINLKYVSKKAYFIQWAPSIKKVFCAVLLQFRINHTCIHTLTSTHMHAYIHQKETTPFYTVNNAMYPWHNQKDSAKAIAWSVFFRISMHISLVHGICTTYKTKMHIIPGSEGTQEHHKSNHLV